MPSRSRAISKLLITYFFGFLGVHKFMDKKTGMGFLYLFTVGLFGFGWIYDCITVTYQCIKVFITTSKSQTGRISYHPDLPEQDKPVYDFNKPYDSMEGHEFEYFCSDLLRKNNYNNVEVTKGSGDQGIDIIAYKDGIKYGIQCKCYSSDIGNKAVQEAFAGKTFYKCHVAVVLTNRHFTRSAIELSESNKVLLWDREKLEELISNAQ